MASLSNYDKTYLTVEQQAQIKALKEQYAAAQTDAERQSLHQQAEDIRKTAGYSGGASGAEGKKLSAADGGQSADQVRAWAEDYNAVGYDEERGWINGYSTAMNTRSKANYIRQQMQANSDAWHTADAATRDYLHQQNVELAKVLADSTGMSEKSYSYDPTTGKWSTWNTNLGYGSDSNWTQTNIADNWKEYYGYTDADRAKWDADTSRYYNFVDTRAPARNQVDESSGFTGQYAQFVNGPHVALQGGATGGTRVANPSLYQDLIGDGFHDEQDGAIYRLPTYDENGEIVKTAPALKNNNGVSDYTNQFTAYTQNGVIMPNTLQQTNPANAHRTNGAYTGQAQTNQYAGVRDNMSGYVPNVNDGNDLERQAAYMQAYKAATGGSAAGNGGNGYSDYLNQMYDAALQAQLSQLETSYNQNISDLDASVQKTEDQYRESRRQTTGQSAQDAAAWREIANAYGLNSGAIGQAALAQNNQLQSDLNTLQASERAAQDELERNRVLLGQQYQAAINEAMADNDMQRAQALYQEAVRLDEQMAQQAQQNAQLGLQYAQLAMQQSQWQQEFNYQMAQNAASSGGGSGSPEVVMEPDYAGLYAAASQSENPSNYLSSNYKKFGLTSSAGLASGYKDWAESQSMAKGIVDQLYHRFTSPYDDLTDAEKRNLIDYYYQNYLIDDEHVDTLLDGLRLG